MTLQAIGAGLPRTGTTSLKAALEQLLEGNCYHMDEFFTRVQEDWPLWWAAFDGDRDALARVTADWVAALDWPASILWRELAAIYPHAPVILSHRGDSATWWKSVDATVWGSMRMPSSDVIELWNDKMRKTAGLGEVWDGEDVARNFYDTHMQEVIDTIEPDRLLVWEASEGWGPLCTTLGVPVPESDFMHRNTTAEFLARRDGHDDGARA